MTLVIANGYQEPASGVWHSSYNPLRFLKPLNYTPVSPTGMFRVLISGIVGDDEDGYLTGNIATSSRPSYALHAMLWHKYDEYLDKKRELLSLGSPYATGNTVYSSGIVDWVRDRKLIWYYDDFYHMGQYRRPLIKSVAFPYDDIGFHSGDPVVFNSGFSIGHDYPNTPITLSGYLSLNWYQLSDLIQQIHPYINYIFDNIKTNKRHPTYLTLRPAHTLTGGVTPDQGGMTPDDPMPRIRISGINVPSHNEELLFSMNNLNLKPTSLINSIYTNLGAWEPGSGYQPSLDYAQQVLDLRDYIYSIFGASYISVPNNTVQRRFPWSSSISLPSNPPDGDVFINTPSMDMIMGYHIPRNIINKNMIVSGVNGISSVNISGQTTDPFGNSKTVVYEAKGLYTQRTESQSPLIASAGGIYPSGFTYTVSNFANDPLITYNRWAFTIATGYDTITAADTYVDVPQNTLTTQENNTKLIIDGIDIPITRYNNLKVIDASGWTYGQLGFRESGLTACSISKPPITDWAFVSGYVDINATTMYLLSSGVSPSTIQYIDITDLRLVNSFNEPICGAVTPNVVKADLITYATGVGIYNTILPYTYNKRCATSIVTTNDYNRWQNIYIRFTLLGTPTTRDTYFSINSASWTSHIRRNGYQGPCSGDVSFSMFSISGIDNSTLSVPGTPTYTSGILLLKAPQICNSWWN